MYSPKFLRRLFIPSASSLFVVHAKGTEPEPPPKNPACENLVKAVDLPLYSDYKSKKKEPEKANEHSLLVTTIRCMRQELWLFMEQVQVVKQEISQVYLTGKAHTLSTVEYLRNKDNLYPRVGAITAGALTGYMLALRKGRFKRLIYMGAGAGAVSAVLYPEEAESYADDGLTTLKKYVIIAYHFANGDYFSGKNVETEDSGGDRKKSKNYVPTKLQQEYLDVQSGIDPDPKCTCKKPDQEE